MERDSITMASYGTARLEGLRILLAEDSPDNCLLFSIFLKSAGANVDVAVNGREAVNLASRRDYDVVLMDLQMPEMDGFGALKTLRGKGFEKPIIALTAHAMASDKEKCLNAGFNDHLTKPISQHTLIDGVAFFAKRLPRESMN